MMKNKYGARKVTDAAGQKHDSAKEYRRWCELQLLERAGQITKLRRQVSFELIPAQREESTEVYKAGPKRGQPKPGAIIENPVRYIADFTYIDLDDNYIVEDVKGYKKGAAYEMFKIKRKLMLYIHGIRVKEV